MITLNKRIELIHLLPIGAVIAEVGTWRGYFAIEILNNTSVSKLYCVDAWQGQTGIYSEQPKTVEEHEKDLAETKHHLRGWLGSGRVEIVRGFSVKVAETNSSILPLDAAYIDADHSYEGCLADLKAWAKRLKPTGCLLGHDYSETGNAKKWNFGVVRAVKDFCEQEGWEITHLTKEDFASFRLAKVKTS